jgi:hypothetical protein
VAYTGTIEVKGLAEMVDKLQGLDRELRKDANTMLRRGAKDIAIAATARRASLLGGSGVPADSPIVEATRPKYDRYMALAVPGVKPKMSGLRRTPAARAKSLAIAMEYGSTDPRLKGPPRGALVGRNIRKVTVFVRDDYANLVYRVLKRYGLI